jgi:flagellar biosynthetic protein FliR
MDLLEDILAGTIPAFLLVLTRIGAFFATAPVFSWRAVPNTLKVVITIGISLFYAAFLTKSPAPPHLDIVQMTILTGQEALYGICLGLVCSFFFSVVRQVGHFIEREMGLTMASVLDPFSGSQGQALSMLLEILFILLLFNTDGHHLLLQALGRSFDRYAPGAIPSIGQMTESIVMGSSAMFLLVLRMAAPMLTASLLLMVVLGFMARVAPETNILFLSLPLRVGLGLMIVGVFIPFINEYLQQFANWTVKLLPF